MWAHWAQRLPLCRLHVQCVLPQVVQLPRRMLPRRAPAGRARARGCAVALEVARQAALLRQGAHVIRQVSRRGAAVPPRAGVRGLVIVEALWAVGNRPLRPGLLSRHHGRGRRLQRRRGSRRDAARRAAARADAAVRRVGAHLQLRAQALHAPLLAGQALLELGRLPCELHAHLPHALAQSVHQVPLPRSATLGLEGQALVELAQSRPD
mmetsp:Transcript_11267/g.29066  ORF Transcript_11267/g.29066 Transcript_11267/m.29066 type:complete len:209 (-) Transcript_11267:117-743(-)